MSVRTVLFTPRARRQLRSIERYIAKKASPREAADYVARIIRRCDAIATAPYQGESLERLRPGMRRTGMEGRVSIVFTVELEKVAILAIAYGGRQFETALRS